MIRYIDIISGKNKESILLLFVESTLFREFKHANRDDDVSVDFHLFSSADELEMTAFS